MILIAGTIMWIHGDPFTVRQNKRVGRYKRYLGLYVTLFANRILDSGRFESRHILSNRIVLMGLRQIARVVQMTGRTLDSFGHMDRIGT
jgi:hypothetical protein